MNMDKTLTSYSLSELTELMRELSEPQFRAKQVYEGIYLGKTPASMSNIPISLREKLSLIPFGGAKIERRLVSPADGTVKYLFRLDDNNLIEGVLMKYKYGNTLCISTQVGCRMGCAFCASTLNGCVRDLQSGEMLSEVLAAEYDPMNTLDDGKKRVVTNIVLMGSGEPLDNYDNTIGFLRLVTAEGGINVSPRNISLSTCGLVDKIMCLIDDGIHVTLSLSLHAPNDSIRSTIMPVNNKYRVAEVISAAKQYSIATGRRVIFEYALIKGKNDAREHAEELAKRLHGINCHVNLIPLNDVAERDLQGTTRKEAQVFCGMLESLHISATIRREMGADIDGACGQLRRRVLTEEGFH